MLTDQIWDGRKREVSRMTPQFLSSAARTGLLLAEMKSTRGGSLQVMSGTSVYKFGVRCPLTI